MQLIDFAKKALFKRIDDRAITSYHELLIAGHIVVKLIRPHTNSMLWVL